MKTRQAILEAMKAIGGECTIPEVKNWISRHHGEKWKDISTDMADLTFPGLKSSTYRPEERFLERVRPGVYRFREGWK